MESNILHLQHELGPAAVAGAAQPLEQVGGLDGEVEVGVVEVLHDDVVVVLCLLYYRTLDGKYFSNLVNIFSHVIRYFSTPTHV